MTKIIIPLLALILSTVVGQAQNQPVKTDTIQSLSEVVITSMRTPGNPCYTPDAISRLTAKAMQKLQKRTTPEALQLVPGVFVQMTNHGGGSPFIRGLTGNQVLMLIDGVRLNNATFRYGPNQYLNTVDALSVDNIEVLRGNGSVQYGSDALGGTVQVFSLPVALTAGPALHGAVLLRGATQGMEKTLRTQLTYSNQRAGVQGGFSLRDFGDLVGGDTTGHQTPSGYAELDYDFKGRFLFKKNIEITVLHQKVAQTEVPVFHKVQLEQFKINAFDPQQRMLTYVRTAQQLNKRCWKSWNITLSGQQTQEGRISQKNNSNLRRYEQDDVRTWGGIAQVEHRLSSFWTAVSGLEWYHDRVKSFRKDTDESTGIITDKRGLYPNNSTMQSAALFTMHQWDTRQWRFNAGLRGNAFEMRVEEASLGRIKINPVAWVGNIAALRKLGKAGNVFLAANTGFRAPNIDDLGTLGIVDFRYEVPNYGLKPERSVQVQLGYKIRQNRFAAEVTLYRNNLNQLITRIKQDTQTIQGYPVYAKENTEYAFVQGVEMACSYRLFQHWQTGGTWTYTYGRNMTQREPMRRIPPVFGDLYLQYIWHDWTFKTVFSAAGKQDLLAKGDMADNRIPTGGTPAWQTLNLYINYEWKQCQASLSALNLLNEDYRTHGSGINGYGRSAFLSLGIHF